VASSMFISSWKGRLVWSWIIGLAGTITGILFSYSMNISNGPAVVCLLGILVFVMALVKLVRPLQHSSINKP
jgi:ABC-type Mn2+/Zn2+ transport system permease subunit